MNCNATHEGSTELPSELCRFRSFASPKKDGKDLNAVYDLLRGRLQFADITSFNDAFEARPAYLPAFKDAGKQRHAMLRYLTQIAPANITIPKRRKWAEKVLRGRSMADLVSLAAERSPSGRYFALCLMAPETVSTSLPWAHYADEGRGVCIHLDATKRPLHLSFPVVYSDEYPELVVPRTERNPGELLEKTLFRKSTEWKYELEYRVAIVINDHGSIVRDLGVQWEGNIAIAPADIAKSVTLGYRMTNDAQQLLINWIENNAPHVRVWRSKLSGNKYEILREPVG